ncbi:hypothetical protein [Candidatus Poriferisodalis sp.]|uniref:hypothetical protein n=1 Tax=Candidatus Poriferisodalis sp. TaxID=3101277 RepID=UPI003B51C40B
MWPHTSSSTISGWLGPDRVRCISEPDVTVTLAPVARPGEEVVMAALVSSGRLPMAVAGDSGDGQVDSFPVLRRGESVTLRGYTITVIGDNDDTHTVTITLNL